MISEVTWVNPDGVELTNFRAQAVSIDGWVICWLDVGSLPVFSASLSGQLAPGLGVDTTFVLQDVGGGLSAIMGILEYDS